MIQKEVFFSVNDRRFTLKWERREYRAYEYKHGGWTEMNLGSTQKNSLIKHIKSLIAKEN